MTDEPRPSFYDAVSKQSRAVSLGRVFTVLHTPSVRQYMLYKERLRQLQETAGKEELAVRTGYFARWLETVIGSEGVANILPDEVIAVVNASAELYVDPPAMEWQKIIPLQPGQKPPDTPIEDNLDYDGRVYAYTIAMVCKTYGWQYGHVLDDMSIYEMGIYAQEAMLLNHQDREWDYVLSEVGYKKVGDKYEKQMLPPLPWVRRGLKHALPKQLTPVPSKFLPGGGTEVWKPGVGLVEKRPQEGEVQGLRLNPETGKVETYAIKWASDAGAAEKE